MKEASKFPLCGHNLLADDDQLGVDGLAGERPSRRIVIGDN